MKRKAERVLGIIGIVMMTIGTLLLALTTVGLSSPGVQEDIESMFQNPQDPELQLTGEDLAVVNEFINHISDNGLFMALVLFFTVVLGIIATVFVRKKPVLSGVMWLLAAIISLITIWYFIFIPAILFIIAGIMALVRRTTVEQEQLNN